MGVMLKAASRHFGRYELLEYLGSGGMSDVFVALHTGLRKRVALKLLRPSLRHDQGSMQRFMREGECAARVTHPNVVAVTDVGMEQGIPYLVMELLEGETLEQKLEADGPFTLQGAVDVMLPILDAVAATHAAGVLHRDIKPANILLAKNHDGSLVPKLVDFGIATFEERRNITGALGPIGTPHYMSPEQARGARDLDERSDQYSLASMLFEMLTGREPFVGADINAVLVRVARGKFPRVTDHRPSLPGAIDDVLAHATELDPAQRFLSVTDLAHALVPFASPRTRKLWISRDARAGLLSAQLLSGVWRADADPHETTRMATTVIGKAPRRPGLRKRALMATLAFVALVCGVSVGVGYLRVQAHEPTPAAASALTLPAASIVKQPALAPRAAHTVYVEPVDAEVLLDGTHLGRGSFTLPPLHGDSMHELRISAEGYMTRIMLFRSTLQTQSIELEAL